MTNKSIIVAAALSLVGLGLTGSAVAAQVWSTSAVTVTNIVAVSSVALPSGATVPTSGSATYLKFSSVPNQKPSCATTSTNEVRVWGSADQVKAVTSIANASFLSGKTVRVQWDGCDGTSTYGTIVAMELVN
jgi:hypothetical protein